MTEEIRRHVLPIPNDPILEIHRENRIALCRASQNMQKAIEGIETSDQTKNELLNMNTVLLRMSLALSDGNLSPEKLRIW